MSRLTIVFGLLCLLAASAVACFAPPRPFLGVTADEQLYRSGETAALALTMATKQKKAETLTFPSSKLYDFSLFSEDNPKEPVWQWSQELMYTQAFTRLTLEPGQPITFVVKTDFKLLSGTYPPPGKYRLQAELCVHDKSISSASIPIEIK